MSGISPLAAHWYTNSKGVGNLPHPLESSGSRFFIFAFRQLFQE